MTARTDPTRPQYLQDSWVEMHLGSVIVTVAVSQVVAAGRIWDSEDGSVSNSIHRRTDADKAAAVIIQRPNSITLRCDGRNGSQDVVAWWLYRCPTGPGPIRRIPVPLTSPHYDVLTLWTPATVTSSLTIKDLRSAETSGLYRCTASPHYFVVGRRSTLRSCLPGYHHYALLETIRGIVGVAESGTREFLLRIPGTGGTAHDYRIRFSDREVLRFAESDAMPFIRG